MERDGIRFGQQTRVNRLNIGIRLSDWSKNTGREMNKRYFKKQGLPEPFAYIRLIVGTVDSEISKSIIDFLRGMQPYSIAFIVEDTDRSVTVQTTKRSLSANPFIDILKMSKGAIINSVGDFTMTLGFWVGYKDLRGLIDFLRVHSTKDLEFEIKVSHSYNDKQKRYIPK